MSPEVVIVRRRRRRVLRRVRRLVSVLGWVATFAFLYFALPDPFGARLGVTVVSGNSMLPTYQTGEAVITWRTGDYAPGTPIVYAVPGDEVGAGVFVVHRVVRVEDGAYITRGDNNLGDDPWRPTDKEVQGKVVLRVPHGEFLLRWVTSPLAMAAACGMFTVFAVLTSGRSKRKPPDDQDDAKKSKKKRGRRRRQRPPPADDGHPEVRRVVAGAATMAVLLAVPVGHAASLDGVATQDLLAGSDSASLTPSPITILQTLTSDQPLEYCATVTVTNISAESVAWHASINVSTVGASSIASSSNVTTISFTPTEWEVTGVAHNAVLVPAASTQFQYCAARVVPDLAPADVSLSVVAGTTQVCVTATVSTDSEDWVRWTTTIDHSTPGLTNPSYWLTEAPTNAYGLTTISFTPGTGAWVLRGGADNAYVTAGTDRTFGWCAPLNDSAPAGNTTSTVTVTSFGSGQYCASVTVTTAETDWVRWESTISHTTPGLTGSAYWLSAAPTSPSNGQTVSFDAGTGTWVVEGVSHNSFVKAGSPATWTYCAPTSSTATHVEAVSAVTVTSFGGTQYCANVAVSTPATDWVRWKVTISHSTPGVTATPYWLAAAGTLSNGATVSFDAGTGTWVVEGVSHNAFIKSGTPASWSFCAPTSTAVLTEATSAVTVTSTVGGQFCASVTVSTASSDWIAWKSTIDHTTPGVSAASYWLTAAPTTQTNVQTHSFTAASGTWVAKGVTHNSFIKSGSPVSWSYCAPLQTSGDALVDATVTANVDSSWPTGYCATVTVSTTSPTPIAWRATINHSTPGLTASNRWLTSVPSNFWNAQSQSFTAASGTWVLIGASHNATISAGSPTTFGFCAGS